MSIDFSLESIGSVESNPSSPGPIIKWSEEWWAERPNLNRCAAHRRNGNQCKHPAMNGTRVCRNHGGNAPQVKRKAKIRIEEATDKLARFLLEMASDTTIPEGVRLTAIRDGLDRGGLGVKQAMEIEVSAKPYEKVFEKVISGPRVVDGETVDIEEEEPGSLKARLALKRSVNEYSDIED